MINYLLNKTLPDKEIQTVVNIKNLHNNNTIYNQNLSSEPSEFYMNNKINNQINHSLEYSNNLTNITPNKQNNKIKLVFTKGDSKSFHLDYLIIESYALLLVRVMQTLKEENIPRILITTLKLYIYYHEEDYEELIDEDIENGDLIDLLERMDMNDCLVCKLNGLSYYSRSNNILEELISNLMNLSDNILKVEKKFKNDSYTNHIACYVDFFIVYTYHKNKLKSIVKLNEQKINLNKNNVDNVTKFINFNKNVLNDTQMKLESLKEDLLDSNFDYMEDYLNQKENEINEFDLEKLEWKIKNSEEDKLKRLFLLSNEFDELG